MEAIKTICLAVEKYKVNDYCDRLDAFIQRNWKPFLAGFFTLAAWNFIRWFI